MPGLVAFGRRWSVGSDDLIVPAILLITFQLVCVCLLSISIFFNHKTSDLGSLLLFTYEVSYLVILFASIVTELGMCKISLRGTILETESREPIKYWLYFKTVLILIDTIWLILGAVWIVYFLAEVTNELVKTFISLAVFFGWVQFFTTSLSIYVTYDKHGHSYVNGHWRQSQHEIRYHKSWEQRFRFVFCCVASPKKNEITDISRVISDFFLEFDLVPSDIAAGLILLRNFQKLEMEDTVKNRSETGILRFLSGVPIRDNTVYLSQNDSVHLDSACHYMHFANAAYGWPLYAVENKCGLCKLMPAVCTCCYREQDLNFVEMDNLCNCHYTALKKTLKLIDNDVIYVTYHVDIGESPFFVAVDYDYKKIVISIRGTLCMEDILTDLDGEYEVVPLKEPRKDWITHRGMLKGALYVREKLKELNLIEKAFRHNVGRQTETFGLVVVGHSLGAGIASILGIFLKEEFPTMECFCFSPPGGLLSLPLMEYSKTFTTTIVLGMDVIPRIGLRQMENLRADLMNVFKESNEPKYKILFGFNTCCCLSKRGTDFNIENYKKQKINARCAMHHTLDNDRVLPLHIPLYPPGRIIHIGKDSLDCKDENYKAIWTDANDYDEVLVSSKMMKDHLPDLVLAALKDITKK